MDDDSSLHLLVAQRMSRPAFARMISWEIGNSDPANRRRRREYSTASADTEGQSDEEERGDNSEDSEYYSAEEEAASDDSQSNYSSIDNATSTTGDMENDMDSLDLSSEDPKRRLSKKQKKKRRDKLKNNTIMAYADYDVPFRNVEDLDFDVSDIVDDLEEDVGPCTRSIPTLFQLCVSTISRRRPNKPRPSTSDLPEPLKHVLSLKRRDQSLVSVQLSWLYRLLGLAEENLESSGFIYNDDTKGKMVNLPVRNIWSSSNKDRNNENHVGSDSSAILLYSYILYEGDTCGDKNWRYPLALLSVVASAVDLMLPQQLSTSRLRHASKGSSSESELIRKTTDSIVYSVRQILKQRYPDVVEHFFDMALPYVYWTRGNLRFAAESFLKLAQSKEGPVRAIILSEAARMYAQNDEREKAQRLYNDASGIVIMKAQVLKEDHDVKLQEFMIMASLYDQGEMTPDKCNMAFSSWTSAMKFYDPRCPWSSAIRAADSFLCFHSGCHSESMKEYLLKVCGQLEAWCKHCDHLLLPLSLVKAILGDESGSYKTYKAFTVSPSAALTELEVPAEMKMVRKYTPWLPLVNQHNVLQLLKVVWRTQLNHPRIVNDGIVFEGSFQPKKNLNLHMTENGYLTADLQMLVPPIRALCLDPYTGLHLHSSGQTQDWHSLSNVNLQENENSSGFFLVPTLCELYSDEEGNRVQLLSPNAALIAKSVCVSKMVTLFWTGSNGERAKLNLIPYLKDVVKQCALECVKGGIREGVDPKKNIRGSVLWAKDIELGVEFCYRKGFCMSIGLIENMHYNENKWRTVVKYLQPKKTRQELKSELMAEKKKNKGKRSVKKSNAKIDLPAFGVVLESYRQYKDTLFLSFLHNSNTTTGSKKKINVFIGCSSKSEFLSPVLTMENTYNGTNTADKDRPCSSLADNIMWYEGCEGTQNSLKNVNTVYGRKGEVMKVIQFEEDVLQPQVIGNKFYKLSADKLSVESDDCAGTEQKSGEMGEIQSLMVGGRKLICVTGSAIYFLDENTLKPLSVKVTSDSKSLEASDDSTHIQYRGALKTKVLEERQLEGGRYRLALGLDNSVIFVDVQEDAVEVVMEVQLAGWPREVYTIGSQVGFLVTASILRQGQHFYRENLYYCRYDGQLVGLLPFLGPGPRSFCVKFLTGVEGDPGGKGWHVFLRDGHEGIMGVKLP